MEENSKKRSRKTKLVPRQYLDSDDENIAIMQQEIEAELAKIKAKSLLKKLSSSSSQSKADLQFSVKVEIEEYEEELTDEEIFSSIYNNPVPAKVEKVEPDTTLENVDNSTSKTKCTDIDTVTNLKNIPKNGDSNRDNEVKQDINIRIESVRSLQSIDKIEVTYYKITKIMIKREFEIFSKTTTDYVDKLLEIHIRNYFGQVNSEVKLNKTETKLQEVLTRWKVWWSCYRLVRDTPLMYICYICRMAWWHLHDFKEHMKFHSRFDFKLHTEDHKSYIVATYKKRIGDCDVAIESNCWRCGKDIFHHRKKFFICDGCGKVFQTCLLLTMHEGCCEGNRKLYQKNNDGTHIEFICFICPWKHWKEEELLRHQIGLHSVRSDLPVPMRPSKCGKCKEYFNKHLAVHECIFRPLKESCGFCFRKFQSKSNLLLHYWVSPNNFKCRVCGKLLKKDCMEFKHLLEHSDNYKMLYMCLVCQDSLCFFDLHSAKNHTTNCHLNKEKTSDDYCPMVIPKSLLERLVPMKMLVPVPEENDTTQEDLDVDSALNGLLGYLNKSGIQKMPQQINVTVNKKNEDIDNNIEITIINRNAVRNIMNSVESTEIPDIIKNIKQEDMDDVNDSNYKLQINKNNDGPEQKFKTYSRTKSKKSLQATDVGDVVKESVTIEVPHIKEEPMDIDEINGINETNDIDSIDNNNSNDINLKNGMDNNALDSVLQRIDDINLPIKLEIQEESDDMYEDEDGIMNEHVINSTISREVEKPRRRRNVNNGVKKKVMENYMWIVHNVESSFTCTKCNSTFETFKKYLMHFINHDYTPLTCPKCFKPMTNEQQFWTHVNYHIKSSFIRVHCISTDSSDKSGFQCKKCYQVLGYSEFFKHWEAHLDIRSGDVNTQFSVDMDEKPNLKQMIILLKDPDKLSPSHWKTRSCFECNKRFERKNDYKRHLIEHLLRDAFNEKHTYGCLKCQICGQGFSSADRYKRHLRDHASLPVYKCELCDKAFSDSSNFSKHKKVHNLSVVVCNICKKKFQKKQCLAKHMEMHEVTKPIVCKTCNKVFYSQSVYTKHLKKYRQRFKCQACVTYYDTLKEKWDHMWEVHKERQNEADCPFCDNLYRKYTDVKKHIKDDHNNAFHEYYNKFGKVSEE